MDTYTSIVSAIDSFLWGIPLITLILLGDLWLTFRLHGLQIRRLPLALKYMVRNETNGEGEISSFAALCTALSATIGTGNIVGVATAIQKGGPGALFWMLVAGFLGMATKYSEGFLAVKYRKIDKNNHALGGAFYYIEKGMGPKWKWMAKAYALFACLPIFGGGTVTHVNAISDSVQNFCDPLSRHQVTIPLLGTHSWAVIITSIVVTLLAGLVIIGGIKRISSVSEFVVPFMAGFYVLFVLALLIFNYRKLPDAIALIFTSAFRPRAVLGGTAASLFLVMQSGISRGMFSNEAGLGSAAIASAAANAKSPVRQGLVCMTGTFIDTIIICNMTGLAIVTTGAWKLQNVEGAAITIRAFQMGLPIPARVTSFLLMMALVFFAFTSVIGWNYYGERSLEYLCNNNRVIMKIYRYLYIFMIFIGPYLTVSAVWTTADIFNGLMAIPNMIALFALSGQIARDTKSYFAEKT